MYFVYIIKSKKNDSLYIGVTNEVTRRLREHNEGKTFSTKRYLPWYLVYVEGYYNK